MDRPVHRFDVQIQRKVPFRFADFEDGGVMSEFRCIEQELRENRILVDTNIPARVNLLKITLSIELNQGKAGS